MVTRRLPDVVESRLRLHYSVTFNDKDEPLGKPEITKRARGCTGIIATVTDQIDRSLIEALPESIEIIANFGVGTDHIDLEAARMRGIAVTNTPGVLTEATADIAMLLLLTAARRASAACKVIKSGEWKGWAPTSMIGHDIQGKRLAILGMGRIGSAVARRARAFGLQIHYHNRRRLSPAQEVGAIFHSARDSLLAVADFLSIHTNASNETRGMIDARAISLMPRGAILINTARGDLIDDEAVLSALDSRHLAAIGLDVFNNEPAFHPGYLSQDDAVILPHIGSATPATRTAMGNLAVDNLDAFFNGEKLPGRVI